MSFPKLTKEETLKLECARISHDADNARRLYDFIATKDKPVKPNKKK